MSVEPLSVDDRGLLYAEACFETFRVLNGAIFAWEAHMARLRSGLREFGLKPPPNLLSLCRRQAELDGDDVLMRLTVTGGEAPRALLPEGSRKPRVYIRAWACIRREEPLFLRTVQWPQVLPKRAAKFTADYALCIRALRSLRAQNQLAEGEEALICDRDRLVSAPTSNLLLHVRGRWLTPDSDSALPGIVRGALIAAGVITPEPCPQHYARICDAAALTNSGAFIRPVTGIDGRRLPLNGGAFTPLYAALNGQEGVPELPE